MTSNLVAVLSLLDDMATRHVNMGWADISDLCKARETLAKVLDLPYNEDTSRYTEADLD